MQGSGEPHTIGYMNDFDNNDLLDTELPLDEALAVALENCLSNQPLMVAVVNRDLTAFVVGGDGDVPVDVLLDDLAERVRGLDAQPVG